MAVLSLYGILRVTFVVNETVKGFTNATFQSIAIDLFLKNLLET